LAVFYAFLYVLTKAEQQLVKGGLNYLCWGEDGQLEYSPEDASSHMYHCVPIAVVSASASPGTSH